MNMIIRRVSMILAAAVLAVAGLTAAPADAALNPSTVCRTIGSDSRICLQANWRTANDGQGTYIDSVYELTYEGTFQDPAVDCYSVRLTNPNGVVKWEKTGNTCDVPGSPGYRLFYPQMTFPNSGTMTVRWSGNANLAGEPDVDFAISITVG